MILAAGTERGAQMETWELNEKKKEYLLFMVINLLKREKLLQR